MTIRPLIRLLLFLAIVALFLHQRMAPHSASLGGRMGRFFRIADRVFGPPLKFLRAKLPPLPIGPGLSLESSHLTLLILLLSALTVV
ncbi:MAG: hypothetical protein KBF76_18015 [Verrucomicrobiales bacterium]|jgi:hypothetical protein|nr:hypothetical protein [Verrucomicrobiales bacterium]HQZ28896.1 hypothetical protein [Verrucomicrobiales bacterium]